jgi:hypothetical protein
MTRSKVICVILLAAAVLGVGLYGCKAKKPKQVNRTLKGTVESIDLTNKTVTMSWFNEKIGRSMPISARITNDTEIYIDGKLSDLSQVKENDPVVAEGFQKGGDTVVQRVKIIRAPEPATKIVRPTQSKPAK